MFFFQAIQERHENSLLKTEIEKLRDKNKTLRETINKACCPNCGVPTTNRDGSMPTEEQQLRIENAKLKSEVNFKYTLNLSNLLVSLSCLLLTYAW